MVQVSKKVLLTGGAGFIGSHTYVELIAAGYDVTILDNFENARRDVPDRLAQITQKTTKLIECDIRAEAHVEAAFRGQGFDAVVHFAARKSIAEGETDPLGYHQTNCNGLVNIVAAMQTHGVKAIVFSSSAAIYGSPDQMPIGEDTPPAPQNAYAWTKLFGEEFLDRMRRADPALKTGILRYFNPVGAHASGLIGEDPSQPPANLVPIIARVASGDLAELTVLGDDYPTPDGTGVRDYIHIGDLARGHVLSLDALLGQGRSHLVNLGTGRGYSVMEVLRSYAEVSGRAIPHRIVPRRSGDAATSFAQTRRAREILGFEAEHDLRSMCDSNWRFICQRDTVTV